MQLPCSGKGEKHCCLDACAVNHALFMTHVVWTQCNIHTRDARSVDQDHWRSQCAPVGPIDKPHCCASWRMRDEPCLVHDACGMNHAHCNVMLDTYSVNTPSTTLQCTCPLRPIIAHLRTTLIPEAGTEWINTSHIHEPDAELVPKPLCLKIQCNWWMGGVVLCWLCVCWRVVCWR